MTRTAAIVLAIVIGAPAAGAVYQTLSVRRGTTRFPPPGRLVDVGGRRLHLLCIGEGQPTVIFESGLFGSSVSFAQARDEIARHARVCSYDRMGTGWSDPGPDVISVGALADDLDRLLDRAIATPPYIVEAASIGGLVAEMYTRRHPDRVAALVLVDAGHSGVLEPFAPHVTATMRAEACLLPTVARVGILRALDPLHIPASEPDATWRIYRAEPMTTLCGLVRGLEATLREFREAAPLARDLPLTVLTAEASAGLIPFGFERESAVLARDWRAQQQALSRRSSRGTWRVVPGSDHLIGNSQPHAVAEAVLEVLRVPRTAAEARR